MGVRGVAHGGARSKRRKMIFGNVNLNYEEPHAASPDNKKVVSAATASSIMGELSSTPAAPGHATSPRDATTPASTVADAEPTKAPKKRKHAPERN